MDKKLDKKLMKHIPKEYKKLVTDIYLGERIYDEDDHRWNTELVVEWENGTKSWFQNRSSAFWNLKEFHMTDEFSDEEYNKKYNITKEEK